MNKGRISNAISLTDYSYKPQSSQRADAAPYVLAGKLKPMVIFLLEIKNQPADQNLALF